MARTRTRRPETTKIDISGGDWLLVKKHLTAGEQRRMFDRMYRDAPAGRRFDRLQAGLSQCLEYLLDWSIKDVDGKVIPIRDQPVEAMQAGLDSLDPEDFAEVSDAIDAHDEAMREARAAEKKSQDGVTSLSATSPSAAI